MKTTKTTRKLYLALVVWACTFVSVYAQTILAPAVLEKVQAAVFEVVVEKPAEGNLTYEKKLPLERIPFAIRNDAYLPIGTAFLMNDGKFYSASHVFSLYKETLYTNYFLRGKDGKTWKIASVTKFATDRDFICFDAENFTADKSKGLSVAPDAALNSTVFSVGNALGEGIVIRNGVLTSRTPEQENGAWQWLRFSAAASPGNSGGPLITEKGDVLGIIAMKSQNENLNYALPFAETKNVPDDTGIVHIPFYYRLPTILTERFYHVFDEKLSLPQNLGSLREEITSRYRKNTDKLVHDLGERFAPDADEGFARAAGAAEMLSNSYMIGFPHTIYLTDAGKWDYAKPKEISTHQLGDNGFVDFGSMLGYTFAYIVKPESVALKKLIASPKTYVDYILSASKITRNVAGENIAITSLGDPCKADKHIDRFGRTWLINYWKLPFVDYMAIAYALPMPDGVYVMLKFDSYGDVLNGHRQDMAFIADYAYPSYSAELKNWKEYLALSEAEAGKRDPIIDSLSLDYSKKRIVVKTDAYSVDLPSSVLTPTDDTTLGLSIGYAFKDGKLVQEERALSLSTNKRAENYRFLFISKQPKPGEGALKTTTESWEQKRDCIPPYDGKPYDSEQYTFVDKIIYPNGITYKTRSGADCIYILGGELGGQGKKSEALRFIAAAEKGVRLR